MTARLTFIHALSSLHPGVGQGVGDIDLPIAREKATGLPFLPGSSLKGTLRTRSYFLAEGKPEDKDLQTCKLLFGDSDMNEDKNRASQVQFSDQKLLLFPVRSLAGTFAWTTSPYVLHRLLRDITNAQLTPPTKTIPEPSAPGHCYAGDAIRLSTDQKVYLEDLDLEAEEHADAQKWAGWIGKQVFADDEKWQQMLTKRFCIVHDDVFNYLLRTATEVIARIKLKDNAKTVENGGLWYEEALPAESILCGMLLATPTREKAIKDQTGQEYLEPATIFKLLKPLYSSPLQLGGKATVGRGLCQVRMAPAEVE